MRLWACVLHTQRKSISCHVNGSVLIHSVGNIQHITGCRCEFSYVCGWYSICTVYVSKDAINDAEDGFGKLPLQSRLQPDLHLPYQTQTHTKHSLSLSLSLSLYLTSLSCSQYLCRKKKNIHAYNCKLKHAHTDTSNLKCPLIPVLKHLYTSTYKCHRPRNKTLCHLMYQFQDIIGKYFLVFFANIFLLSF